MMDEEERQSRDNRKWHFSREVPVATIWMAGVFIFALGGAYMSQNNKNEELQKKNLAQDARTEEILIEVREMRKQQQEGSVPSAQNSWKIGLMEQAVLELKSRTSDMERRKTELEIRVLRLENSLSATNARARARDER